MFSEETIINNLRESSRESGKLQEQSRIVKRLHSAFKTNPEATYTIEGIMDLLFTPQWKNL